MTMSPAVEGPLAAELRQIGERGAFPESRARRHHFVPAFLLARWADPVGQRKGRLHQLDVSTGRPQRTSPDSACFKRDFYAQGVDGERNNVLESFFAVVEGHAAPALARLVGDPISCSPEDRQTLSFFLALQGSRTPPGMTQAFKNAQLFKLLELNLELNQPDRFAERYRERIDADADAETIEARRRTMLQQLAAGHVSLADPTAAAANLLINSIIPTAEIVSELRWTMLISEDAEFVTSDRALAMADATPETPWAGHAWNSSPTAQTTVPMGPHHCLILEPGRRGIGEAPADENLVMRVNLRTYGWAERFIYGTSQQKVSVVRRQAKARRSLVVRPKVPKLTLLEEADPDDPEVGREHPASWPKGLWHRNKDGTMTFCAYKVLDPDDPEAIQRAITETIR
jgi:hypothetical protein